MGEELEPNIEEENSGYFGKAPENYTAIVLKCLQEILKVNTNLLSSTGKIYIRVEGQILQKEENTIKIYYQLIDTLEDLLLYVMDEEAQEEIDSCDKGINELYNKYFKIFISKQVSEARVNKLRLEGIIPKDDNLGRWCWEQIEEETKRYYRRKYRALLLLFKRKRELSNKRTASTEIKK